MIRVLEGDCRAVLRTLPDASVHCVVTSPPYYGLRDYGTDGQLGLEATPDDYIATMVAVFREVRRVRRDDGTCWVNMGDSYASNGVGSWGSSSASTLTTGSKNGAWAPGNTIGNTPRRDIGNAKPKDLLMMPARLALALQADGWWLRSDIIWAKPNPMPESVTDRPTSAHEHVFLLSKRSSYFYDADAVREEPTGRIEPMRFGREVPPGMPAHNVYHTDGTVGRNCRNVWTIATAPFSYGRVLRGVGGGSDRIMSPDCPVHGDQSILASKAGCDEQPAASVSARSPYSSHHAQSPDAALAPTEMRPDADCVPGSLDLLDLLNAQTASDHSTQNHRTGRVPETSLHVIDDAQSVPRTGRIGLVCETIATSDHAPGSNTLPGASSDGRQTGPSARTAASNRGKCSCRIIDHFATFPPALAERCIKAGCPHDGTILDPFAGAGTTGLVADRLQRDAVLIELNAQYCQMMRERLTADAPLFMDLAAD